MERTVSLLLTSQSRLSDDRSRDMVHAMKLFFLLLLSSSCTIVQQTTLGPKYVTHTQYLSAPEPETFDGAAPTTLAQCIALALDQSEAVGIANERLVRAQLAEDAVVAATRPRLSLEGRHERRKDVGSSSGGFGSFLEPTNDELKLRAETPLYSGFRNRSGQRAAQAWQVSRMASLQHTRDKTALEVTEAYLAVLDAAYQAETLRSQLLLQRAQISQMQAREAAGDARHSEVLLRQAQAAETSAALIAATEDEEVARETLAFHVGRPADKTLVDPKLALPGRLSLADLRADALASRSDLAALKAAITAREEETETIRRGALPEVTLAGEYFLERGGVSEEVDWLVSLEMTWDLYDSGRRKAEVGEARSLIGEAILSHREQLRRVDLDLRRLLAEIEGAQARAEALEQSLRLANSAHAQATAEYEAGVGQNLEVLAAEDQRLRAQLAISQQALRLQLLVAQLHVATGKPPLAP
jgi:outer membrane protein TolC